VLYYFNSSKGDPLRGERGGEKKGTSARSFSLLFTWGQGLLEGLGRKRERRKGRKIEKKKVP